METPPIRPAFTGPEASAFSPTPVAPVAAEAAATASPERAGLINRVKGKIGEYATSLATGISDHAKTGANNIAAGARGVASGTRKGAHAVAEGTRDAVYGGYARAQIGASNVQAGFQERREAAREAAADPIIAAANALDRPRFSEILKRNLRFHAIVGGVALAGLGVAKVMAARHGMETGGGGHGMQWAVENVPTPSGNGNHTVAMENVSNTYGLGGEGADRHGKTIAKVMGGTAVIGAAVGTVRHLRHRSREARHDAHQAHQDQQWQQAKHDRSEIAREGRQARNSSRRTGVPLVSGGRRLDLVDGTAHALNNRASNYDTAPRAPHVDPVNIDEIVGEHTIRRGRRYNRRHPGH